VSDHEDDGPKRKKKVVTRSYKEPSKVPKKPSPKKKFKSPIKRTLSEREQKRSAFIDSKKSLRKSTAAKSVATQQRLKARHEAERLKPKIVKFDDPIPTQEELLEEAAQTEKENLLSLEKFRKMELEKKKVRPTKGTTYVGPIIRYHSVSMPVLLDETKPKEVPEDLEETKRTTRRSRMAASDAAKAAEKHRCERTFITFENDISNKVFESIFPPAPPKSKRSHLCAVTRMPAKYFDPVTQLPYRNSMAFKILRESYYQMLESKSDAASDPNVQSWLQWRKKSKEARAKVIKIEQ